MANGLSAIVPENIGVRFMGRRCDGTVDQTVPMFYTSIVTIFEAGEDEAEGFEGIKWFHDTALALYNVAGGDPTNKAALDDLALQIATDYVNFLKTSFDEVFPVIAAPEPNGLTDEIIWSYRPNDCYTRQMSAPYNGQPEELMHSDPANVDCEDSEGVTVSQAPCIVFYGPPGICDDGHPQLARYKVCLIGGKLIQTFIQYDTLE